MDDFGMSLSGIIMGSRLSVTQSSGGAKVLERHHGKSNNTDFSC